MRRTECVLVANPTAGRLRPGAPPDRLAGWLRRLGVEVRVVLTGAPGDAVRLARREAEDGVPLVAAAGGDGTVREVAEGISGTGASLAILPCGTANVIARELGIPLDPLRACAVAAHGSERLVDAAWCGDSLWLLACGAGLDARVTRSVSLRWKRRIGMASYAPPVLRALVSMAPFRAEVRVDEGRWTEERVWLALAANACHYAGRFRLGASIRMDDGLLDLFLVTGNRASLWLAAVALALGRLDRCAGVRVVQRRKIDVGTDPRQPVQLDGDTSHETPISLKVAPASLRVRLPAGTQAGASAT